MTTKQPSTINVGFRLPAELVERWNQLVDRQPREVTKNGLVVQLIREWCERQEVADPEEGLHA